MVPLSGMVIGNTGFELTKFILTTKATFGSPLITVPTIPQFVGMRVSWLLKDPLPEPFRVVARSPETAMVPPWSQRAVYETGQLQLSPEPFAVHPDDRSGRMLVAAVERLALLTLASPALPPAFPPENAFPRA